MLNILEIKRRIKAFTELIGKRTVLLFCVAVILGIAWFCVEASFVYVIQMFLVVIGVLPSEKTVFSQSLDITPAVAVLALIAFGLLRSIIIFYRIYISGITNQYFVRIQRNYFLEYGLHRKASISSHELTTIFNETVMHAGTFLMKTSDSTVSLTSCVFFLGAGFYMAPYEMCAAIVALTVAIVPLKFLNGRIRTEGEGLQSEYEKVNRTLLSTLKNKFFLDILGQTRVYIDSGKSNLLSYEVHYKNYYRMVGLKCVIPNFSGTVVVAGITLLSLKFFQTDPMKLMGFFYIFFRLAQSASEASATLGDCRLHLPALYKLSAARQKLIHFQQDQLANRIDIQSCQKIEFKAVDFAYDQRSVLNNFDLTLNKGDRLLLKGPSGSGKSTVILLACGVAVPQSGEVLYDGRSSKDVSINNIISYAGPEPFLIEDTVKNNLLFGNGSSVSEQDIIRVCQKVGIWNVIETLPGKLNCRLNESAQLSTGQRQRLSLARALLKQSHLIVFDEATSNIDYESEQQIFDNISEELENRIAIFISHRDSLRGYVNQQLDMSVGVKS